MLTLSAIAMLGLLWQAQPASAQAAYITGQPTNQFTHNGGSASFTASAADFIDLYWQVDTGSGSGFGNISDGGVYSGANTSTLTITGATSYMNGYRYRLVATSMLVGEGDATSNPATLTVNQPPPTINAVTPNSGSAAGGTSVTITGTNLTGATAVRFGGTSATAFTINSPTSITATTPAGIPGTVDVSLNTTGGSATFTSAYTYLATNASLFSLAINSGTLSPAFAAGSLDYTASVANNVTEIIVRPTPSHASATVTMNGAAIAFGGEKTVSLNVGANTISVVVTAQDGIANRTYTLTVTRAALAPAITAQPLPSTIAAGANTTFSVAATNATGYQWQVDQGQGAGFTSIINGGPYSGATSATLTITGATAGMNGYLYRAVATGSTTPAAVSNSAALTVNSPPAITGQPTASTIAAGANTTFSVTATNATGYQWQVDQGAGFTSISNGGPYSGATTAMLTITGAVAGMNGYIYRVVVTGMTTPNATSNSVALTVNSAPTITGQPSASTIAAGANTTFSVTATNATGYQWQVDQGAGFTSIINGGPYSGATNATLTITGATTGMNGYLYRVVVTGSATPNATSNPAMLTVNSPPTITGHPAAKTIAAGANTTFSVTAIYATGYQWQVDQGAGFSNISNSAPYSGANTATLTVTGATFAMNGYLYRAVATGVTPYAVSNPAMLTVSPPVLTLSPAAGALAGGTTGVAYGVTLSTSGGAAPYGYTLTSGALPSGLTLNTATGAISGSPTKVETASFTVTTTDANGREATAAYTLAVTAGQPVVPDQTVTVPGGTTPADVRLDAGASGGPFDDAELIAVEPPNAGRAEITWGDYAVVGPVAPVGWYLKFTPDPAFSGQVRVRFRLINAAGSATGSVTYMLGHDAAKAAEDVDKLVRGFVQSRQNMIASSIALPGLKERRRMATSADPASARLTPSDDGLTLGYATSLVQLQAAQGTAAQDKAGGSTAASAFNIWVDGALLAHRGDDSDAKWGSFAMVSLGADYLVSERALVGLSFHYDRMTDPTDADAELTGNGWLVGPYASFELGKDVFLDTSLLYGGSANDIGTEFWDGSFDTRRWLFDTAITGQWQLDDVTVLTPRLRGVYFSEQVLDYSVENDAGDRIELDGFAQEQLRISLGAEIARSFTLDSGSTLTPKLGATAGFAGLDGAGLFGSVSTGLSLQTVNGWAIDGALLFNLEDEGNRSVGAKLGASQRF